MIHIKTYEKQISKAKFNIGDIVVCIDDDKTGLNWLGLNKGEEYEIVEIIDGHDSKFLTVKNSNGKNISFEDGSGFNHNRFTTKLKYDVNKFNI